MTSPMELKNITNYPLSEADAALLLAGNARKGRPKLLKALHEAGIKYCPCCKTLKPRSDYRRDRSRWDGLSARCGTCDVKKVAQSRQEKAQAELKAPQRCGRCGPRKVTQAEQRKQERKEARRQRLEELKSIPTGCYLGRTEFARLTLKVAHHAALDAGDKSLARFVKPAFLQHLRATGVVLNGRKTRS